MFTMYQSEHIRVDREGHVATLTFTCPPSRYLRWDGNTWEDWERVVAWLYTSCPGDVLLIRSGMKEGFCRGLHSTVWRNLRGPAERAAFAWRGQRLLQKLVRWPGVSVALIDGICRGVGWEWALACDYRLAVHRLGTRIELPDGQTCLGGSVLLRYRHLPRAWQRLASGATLSAGEAYRLRLVDVLLPPVSEPRGWSAFLEPLGPRPRKRPVPDCWPGLAEERRRFATGSPPGNLNTATLAALETFEPSFPRRIGVWGDIPALEDWLLEAVQEGTTVLAYPHAQRYLQRLGELEQQGFCTPWEKTLLHERLHSIDDLDGLTEAELVFVAPPHQPGELLRRLPPTSYMVWVQPAGRSTLSDAPVWYNSRKLSSRVVPMRILRNHHVALLPDEEMPEECVHRLVAWLQRGDYAVTVFPPDARILASAA